MAAPTQTANQDVSERGSSTRGDSREARSLLDRYRANWPRVGGAVAMGAAGALALAHRRMSKPQLLAALNALALLVHQYEEYEDPGYFPGQFNGGIFRSDEPDHFPLNTNIALIINVPLAYTFYALPVALPKRRWLGIAPVLFGFGQAVGHGLVFNRLAKDRYSPGFLASLLLHVPIGISYLRALRDEGPIEHDDWKKARLYTVAFTASSVAAPNFLLRDKNSPYRFTAKQVGRHTGEHRRPDHRDKRRLAEVQPVLRAWCTDSALPV